METRNIISIDLLKIRKHIRFIIGCFILPFWNWNNERKSKYVYIVITTKQLWFMIYKNMDRIEAAKIIST